MVPAYIEYKHLMYIECMHPSYMVGPADGVVSIVHIFNQLDVWDFTLGIWFGPYIELSLGGSFGGLSLLADLHKCYS